MFDTFIHLFFQGWDQWLSISGLAAIGLFVNQLLLVAALWASPTVMSMVRAV